MSGEVVATFDAGLRVTLAHDYLTETGGAERVAAALVRAFPGAPIITSAIRPERVDPVFGEARVQTTFLQRFAADKARQRAVFPLLPLAFRSTPIGREWTACLMYSRRPHDEISTASPNER